MDEKTLTVYAPQAPEGVSLRLLAAQQKAKTQTLRPALQQWAAQYGSRRPDLPLNFHPAAIRASAVDTPFGAV